MTRDQMAKLLVEKGKAPDMETAYRVADAYIETNKPVLKAAPMPEKPAVKAAPMPEKQVLPVAEKPAGGPRNGATPAVKARARTAPEVKAPEVKASSKAPAPASAPGARAPSSNVGDIRREDSPEMLEYGQRVGDYRAARRTEPFRLGPAGEALRPSSPQSAAVSAATRRDVAATRETGRKMGAEIDAWVDPVAGPVGRGVEAGRQAVKAHVTTPISESAKRGFALPERRDPLAPPPPRPAESEGQKALRMMDAMQSFHEAGGEARVSDFATPVAAAPVAPVATAAPARPAAPMPGGGPTVLDELLRRGYRAEQLRGLEQSKLEELLAKVSARDKE